MRLIVVKAEFLLYNGFAERGIYPFRRCRSDAPV